MTTPNNGVPPSDDAPAPATRSVRLCRLKISNFRNFEHVDVPLGAHAVVVGENKAGKTNLVHALRLVLDTTLQDSARSLLLTDFNDAIPRPLAPEVAIEISVDITGFDDDDDLLALLADSLIATEPMLARLTYRFEARPELEQPPRTESDYTYSIYGGDKPENYLPYDVRRQLSVSLLHALRDASSDLERWRRSPLRRLIEDATGRIDANELQALADGLTEATAKISANDQFTGVATRISDRIEAMTGPVLGMAVTLGLAPADVERITRSLGVLIDDGRRTIDEASLGSANILYLILRLLELERLQADGLIDFAVLAIEEPEAHLHPHLQRLAYADLLRRRSNEYIVLTTHSPHVASVAPLDSIVMLRRDPERPVTRATSTAAVEFDAHQRDDLRRYLDVTRAEMLFARRVLLVEGIAERYIIHALADAGDSPLDTAGITVCVIDGVHFRPYVKLLRSLGIPHAILTDFDPAPGRSLGEARARRLLQDAEIVLDEDADWRAVATANGIFVNSSTLESELLAICPEKSCTVLEELSDNGAARARAQGWRANVAGIDSEQFMKDVVEVGKGRFAQRLASRLTAQDAPAYIAAALRFLGVELAR